MQAEGHVPREIPGLKELAEFRFELRRFLSFSEMASERSGIQAQQYQLLQVVGSLPRAEAASISFLAERMILRHNSTVELVDRAERAGLVRRRGDDRDGRLSMVALTPQGLALLERLVAEHLRELHACRERLLATLNALPDPQTAPAGD